VAVPAVTVGAVEPPVGDVANCVILMAYRFGDEAMGYPGIAECRIGAGADATRVAPVCGKNSGSEDVL